jgi:hypothetical protein
MNALFNPANKFLVQYTGSGAIKAFSLEPTVSPDDALLLAAWLIVTAEPEAKLHIQDVLDMVRVYKRGEDQARQLQVAMGQAADQRMPRR